MYRADLSHHGMSLRMATWPRRVPKRLRVGRVPLGRTMFGKLGSDTGQTSRNTDRHKEAITINEFMEQVLEFAQSASESLGQDDLSGVNNALAALIGMTYAALGYTDHNVPTHAGGRA